MMLCGSASSILWTPLWRRLVELALPFHRIHLLGREDSVWHGTRTSSSTIIMGQSTNITITTMFTMYTCITITMVRTMAIL